MGCGEGTSAWLSPVRLPSRLYFRSLLICSTRNCSLKQESLSRVDSFRTKEPQILISLSTDLRQYHHHHHIVPPARISLTLSRHFSQSFMPLAGLQGYIPYPHIAAVCMFVLVFLLLFGHKWGSIGVHHL